MLQRRLADSGVVYYASRRLEAIGVRHAFSTRLGGISPPPFDSLNLGNPNGAPIQDDYERIWQNYSRLTTSIGCSAEKPLRVHQVHGREVASVEPDRGFDTDCKADAIVSRDSTRTISVRTADCAAILIASADGGAVAAVHAGWRGIVAQVIAEAIAKMLDASAGASASTFVAAIGPCIGFEAFEVGEDVIGAFQQALGADAPVARRGQGKGRVDLREAARLQLLACGLAEENIDSTDRCTFEHREEFFSHRRDKGITGRMAAVIAASPT